MQNTCASLAEKKQKKYSTILYIGWAVFCVFALTAPLYLLMCDKEVIEV